MYSVTFKKIPNHATNLLVNGDLAKELLSLQNSNQDAKELFSLEGPLKDFSNLGEVKIVAYDWQDFVQRFIFQLPEEEKQQYHDFKNSVETLRIAA